MRSFESETVPQDDSYEVHDSRRSRRWIGLIALAVALFAFIPSAHALAEGGFPTGVAAPTSTESCPSSPGVDGLAPGVQPPAWAEHQFVHFFMRPRTSGACLSAGVAGEHGETLQYQGGPVQHSPQLYLLFWGSNFESGVGLRLSEAFHLFYGNLKSENEVKGSTAAWQGIVDQYWSNEGPAYHNAKIAAEGHITSVTAPKNVTYALLDKTISEWVESVKTNYHLTPNQNAQFVVLTAPGSTFSKEVLPEEEKHGKKYFTCGFHKTTGPYTGEYKNEVYSYSLVPYNGDSHCGEEGTETETEEEKLINGTTDTASHEFAEAVTDPSSSREYAPSEPDPYTSSVGWIGKEGNEIADECQEKPGKRLPYRSWVTLLWDDLGGYEKGSPEGECKLEDPPYPAPSAPSATTEGATGVTSSEAAVAGSVNPNGPDAHYYFEYGPTTSYGTKIPTPPGNDAGFGTTAVPVSVKITGLQPGTTYHYRIVASSWVGTTDGEDHTFTTSAPWLIQATLNPHGTLESDQFHGASCWSSTACVAVGYYVNEAGIAATLVERWNGTAWEVQTTPNPAGATKVELEAVSCSSSTACTATGYYETSSGIPLTLAEHWNGTAWKVQTTPNPAGSTESRLESVSCSSSTACTAVGWYQSGSGSEVVATPLAERWNGTAWTIQSVPIPAGAGKYDTGSLRGVSCSSSIACMAVGHYEASSGSTLTLAEIWNGTAWKVQTTQNDGSSYAELEGVSCSSSTACTAVGQYKYTVSIVHALTERWNGTAWEIQQTPNPNGPKETSWDLDAVSCSSATACTAVGSYGDSPGSVGPLLGERWNGTIWEIQAPSDPTGVKFSVLLGVSCTASTLCTGAGYSETYLGNDDIPSVTLAERLIIPAAETEPATEVNGSGGTLNGTVNPEGKQTSYHFEYGTTTSYGTKVPVPDANAGNGTSNIKVSQTITGLQSKTTYHFRLVATSSAGTTNGGDQTFTP